jgi:hypothetical protein
MFRSGFRRTRGLAAPEAGPHTGGMDDLFTAVGLGLLVSAPWLVAIVLVCRREGFRTLVSNGDQAFPTQASQLCSFGPR